MMGRILQRTSDGSYTVYDERVGECFHSVHGAIQESEHVFIRAGFDWCNLDSVRILEVGFGSGLNAYLTLLRSIELNKQIYYEAIELCPLEYELVESISEGLAHPDFFCLLHTSIWNNNIEILPRFVLNKRHVDVLSANIIGPFDVVYFDAFSPEKQPELWQENLFKSLFNAMDNPSVLVTYSAKGEIKRRLRNVGFIVERLPGPPGKREMTRAVKRIK
ncbi:MAG: tRNA (5-methylaminomethyl-2-thiouridine)(34)-methyltransferase MnmD [Bacteroidales bacterium]|nr:tRNA (5-methylaminomethyl-2-thiouridine)(34)-methyltransferase MnmD [Bacteroidales bacterium]